MLPKGAVFLQAQFRSNVLHGPEADGNELLQLNAQFLDAQRYLLPVGAPGKLLFAKAVEDKLGVDVRQFFFGMNQGSGHNQAGEAIGNMRLRLSSPWAGLWTLTA